MADSLRVFDRPLCCTSGVCGAEPDEELVRFAADLDWVGRQGVRVERLNPAQEPGAFVSEPLVRGALQERGSSALPVLVADGTVVASGAYPDRAALAGLLGLVTGAGI